MGDLVGTDYPTIALANNMDSAVYLLIAAFIIAFFLAFGVGANDVANSFGTSVGSKVLTLRQACILATIFEILGAVSMGYNVSSTIRGGMINIGEYNGEVKLLMLGFLASLVGSTLWNLFATLLGMPISGTHSIVGAIIGFSIIAKGWMSVQWGGLIKIVVSWFLSPLLSGIVSVALFLGIRNYIVNTDDSLGNGLISLPIFYSVTTFVNLFSIIHNGPSIFEHVNWWMALSIAGSIAIVVALIIWFFVVPRLRASILIVLNILRGDGLQKKTPGDATAIEMLNRGKKNYDNGHGHVNGAYHKDLGPEGTLPTLNTEMSMTTTVGATEGDEDDDKPEVARLFTFLQILTACFGSFAHGGNDVSNAIGPLVAVMLLFRDGDATGETPWYILLFGGLGISIGLWAWGRKVIQTMGNDLAKITPSTGFTIEIGAAITVLVASKIGIPISTTHCKVGSVVMVGKAQGSKQGVNWRLFANIAATWILTVPLTAVVSAFCMWVFMKTLI